MNSPLFRAGADSAAGYTRQEQMECLGVYSPLQAPTSKWDRSRKLQQGPIWTHTGQDASTLARLGGTIEHNLTFSREARSTVWRLKYLLIGMLFPALIGVGLYIAAPRVSDFFKDAVSDAAADDVQEIFDRETPAQVEAGQLVITEADLNAVISDPANEDNTWHQANMSVEIDDGKVRIVVGDSGDQETLYSVVPVIEDGKLVLTERSGLLSIFKTAQEAISDELETQTNQLFTDSGVIPVSVTAEDGRIVIVTQPSGTNADTSSVVATSTPSHSILEPRPTATP
jgi:anti-sigma regulatory factor (Ser/Thr protein kinase)